MNRCDGAVTKISVVRALLVERPELKGKRHEIARITGFRLNYVGDMLFKINNPGYYAAKHTEYRERKGTNHLPKNKVMLGDKTVRRRCLKCNHWFDTKEDYFTCDYCRSISWRYSPELQVTAW